ncbi:MAG TPA: LysM peptidoglycan-binding domain-containing protein [Chloroflexaceae bacterium]|nr:LysM peptidoglycan-binding domain-containing protein [Chloroflexaceae bacterium]
MTLAKLMIIPEIGLPAVALFNPQQIAINKSVNWKSEPIAESDVGRSQFTHGNPATLTLDLFFDTYELGTDVRLLTALVEGLTTVRRHGPIHRPPICKLVWGMLGIFFEGVITSLNQSFTLFLPSGTPVRATLNCSFQEWMAGGMEARLQNKMSPDVAKRRVVRRGETLSAIAAEEYDDPALWRPIARANGIVNPFALAPGQVLIVPVLSPVERRQ